MKIQSLHFKNLNSLYGEWKIDFTHEDYVQSGIFALTGPTGSGKSTILDAICLALYGYTPRLGNITKSTNEIMSRHTGDCFAEITFLAQGKAYSCRWEQRRAKKKASGALQNPTYEMSDLSDGSILASSRTDVLQCVEEKTGMNYERFTRTILLSQGKFDAFLQAKVEEKSSILEEITGTDIYTSISLHAHEKLRAKKEALSLIEAQNAHITLLSQEDIVKIEGEINTFQCQIKKIQEEQNSLQIQKDWLVNLHALETELAEIYKNTDLHQKKCLSFAPQKERLILAKKANEIDFIYTELNALRQEQTQDYTQITLQEKLIPQAEHNLKTSFEESKNIEKNILLIKENIQKNTPLFQEIRILDHSISLQSQTLQNNQKLLKEEKQKLSTLEEKQKKQALQKETVHKDMQILEKWQKEHQHNAKLITQHSALTEQLKQLNKLIELGLQERNPEKESKNKLSILEKEYLELQKKEKAEQKECEAIQAQKKALQEKMTQLLEKRTLREYQSERDHLLREKALVTRIISLEEERKLLVDNAPCPLCGATSHPYALGNIPQITPIEAQIKDLDTRILKLTEAEKQVQSLDLKIHALTIQNINSKNTLEKNRETTKKLLEEHTRQLETIQKCLDEYHTKNKELVNKLLPFQLKNITEESILKQETIEIIQKDLQKRLLLWQEKEMKKQNLEKEMHGMMTELASNEALIKNYLEKNKKQEESLTLEEKHILEQKTQRKTIFADKNPDVEERILQKNLEEAEKHLAKSRAQYEIHTKNLHNIQTRCQTLREQCTRRNPLLIEKENLFQQALIEKGFDLPLDNLVNSSQEKETVSAQNQAETRYLHACLNKAERTNLEKELQNLEEISHSLKVTLKDRKTKLDLEHNKKLYPPYNTDNTNENTHKNAGENIDENADKNTFQELSLHINTLSDEIFKRNSTLKEVTEKSIHLSQELKRNQEAQQQLAHAQDAITLHKNEVTRFEKLHALIGSADGKKYRNFAQGLTFELLISHANKQLTLMTDRYLLQHDQNAPLKLNVIDSYQGDEIRPTNNLSGGESFIVSLALALGLSQMVSQKVRVDSLFLDEGFGTLDEESLETALDTLTQLTHNTCSQHDEEAKLIGIISHIAALKERIPVQIQLEPKKDGKSALSGAGCQQIA